MKIQYTGLKPVVNAHGISFKEGKEDKFIYLPFAVDILNAINHDYEQKRVYSHELNNTRKSEKPPKRRPEAGSRRLLRQTTAKARRRLRDKRLCCFSLFRFRWPAISFLSKETATVF